MVTRESNDLIRDFIISREGSATKRQVAYYMQNDVPENLRLSYETVIKVIENMQDVRVLEGKRRGQGHKLLIEDKKEFNSIHKELSFLEDFIERMDEETKTKEILDMIDKDAKSQDIIDKMDEQIEVEEKKEKSSLLWSNVFRSEFEYQFFVAVSMLLFHSSVKMNELVKSQKNLQILREKHNNIILKLVNRSSRMLSWDLLEIKADDLKDLQTYNQFFESFRDKI
jgi:hypothetical protein